MFRGGSRGGRAHTTTTSTRGSTAKKPFSNRRSATPSGDESGTPGMSGRGRGRGAQGFKRATGGNNVRGRGRGGHAPDTAPTGPATMSASNSEVTSRALKFGSGGTSVADRYQQLKNARPAERAKAVREGKIWDAETKGMSLKQAKAAVGECQDMCSEFERVERQVSKTIQDLEKTPGTQEVDEQRMITKFKRAAAGQGETLPSDLRPPHVLKKTMDYIIDELVGNAEWLGDVTNFIWDRTRMIRTEFTIQQVSKIPDVRAAVETYERILRFHILSCHQLAAPYRELPDNYEYQQDMEQLSNTMMTLQQYYDDFRQVWRSPNEAEFRSYMAIMMINQKDFSAYSAIQTNWPRELLQTQEMTVALELLRTAHMINSKHGPLAPNVSVPIVQANWERFWNVVKSDQVSYLQACVAEVFFNFVRENVLNSLWTAYNQGNAKSKDWGIAELTKAMSYDTEEETEEFCKKYGFRFAKSSVDGHRYIALGSAVSGKYLPRTDNKHLNKISYAQWVEDKRRQRRLNAVLNGLTVAQAQTAGLIEDAEDFGEEEMDEAAGGLTEPQQNDSLFVGENENVTSISAPPQPFSTTLKASQPTLNPQASTFSPFSNTTTISSFGKPSNSTGAPSSFGKPSPSPFSLAETLTPTENPGSTLASTPATAGQSPFTTAQGSISQIAQAANNMSPFSQPFQPLPPFASNNDSSTPFGSPAIKPSPFALASHNSSIFQSNKPASPFQPTGNNVSPFSQPAKTSDQPPRAPSPFAPPAISAQSQMHTTAASTKTSWFGQPSSTVSTAKPEENASVHTENEQTNSTHVSAEVASKVPGASVPTFSWSFDNASTPKTETAQSGTKASENILNQPNVNPFEKVGSSAGVIGNETPTVQSTICAAGDAKRPRAFDFPFAKPAAPVGQSPVVSPPSPNIATSAARPTAASGPGQPGFMGTPSQPLSFDQPKTSSTSSIINSNTLVPGESNIMFSANLQATKKPNVVDNQAFRSQKKSTIFDSIVEQLLHDKEHGILAQYLHQQVHTEFIIAKELLKKEKAEKTARDFRKNKISIKYCSKWWHTVRHLKNQRVGKQRRQRLKEQQASIAKVGENQGSHQREEKGGQRPQAGVWKGKGKAMSPEMPPPPKPDSAQAGITMPSQTISAHHRSLTEPHASLSQQGRATRASPMRPLPSRPMNTTRSAYFDAAASENHDDVIDKGRHRKRERSIEDDGSGEDGTPEALYGVGVKSRKRLNSTASDFDAHKSLGHTSGMTAHSANGFVSRGSSQAATPVDINPVDPADSDLLARAAQARSRLNLVSSTSSVPSTPDINGIPALPSTRRFSPKIAADPMLHTEEAREIAQALEESTYFYQQEVRRAARSRRASASSLDHPIDHPANGSPNAALNASFSSSFSAGIGGSKLRPSLNGLGSLSASRLARSQPAPEKEKPAYHYRVSRFVPKEMYGKARVDPNRPKFSLSVGPKPEPPKVNGTGKTNGNAPAAAVRKPAPKQRTRVMAPPPPPPQPNQSMGGNNWDDAIEL